MLDPAPGETLGSSPVREELHISSMRTRTSTCAVARFPGRCRSIPVEGVVGPVQVLNDREIRNHEEFWDPAAADPRMGLRHRQEAGCPVIEEGEDIDTVPELTRLRDLQVAGQLAVGIYRNRPVPKVAQTIQGRPKFSLKPVCNVITQRRWFRARPGLKVTGPRRGKAQTLREELLVPDCGVLRGNWSVRRFPFIVIEDGRIWSRFELFRLHDALDIRTEFPVTEPDPARNSLDGVSMGTSNSMMRFFHRRPPTGGRAIRVDARAQPAEP